MKRSTLGYQLLAGAGALCMGVGAFLAPSMALPRQGVPHDHFYSHFMAADDITLMEPASNAPAGCHQRDGHVPQPAECAQFGSVGQERSSEKAKNVILIVGDGLAQQELTAARNYLYGAAGRMPGLDELRATGSITTHALGPDGTVEYVSDAAAAGTALLSGTKTRNGSSGVDAAGKPVMTLLEKAKQAGKRTGAVTTGPVVGSFTAAQGAHVPSVTCTGPDAAATAACQALDRARGGAGSIAEQLIDLRPDVMFGGGAEVFDQRAAYTGKGTHPFVPTNTDWKSGISLKDNAIHNGFSVVGTKDELAGLTAANQDTPVLGLFAPDQLAAQFEPIRPTLGGAKEQPQQCQQHDRGAQPSLAEMTTKATELLGQTEDGFFLQVESAGIADRAAAADACGTVGEVAQLDDAVKAALDYARTDGNTLVVVTGTHAHAGLIMYDETDSVSPTSRLKTADGSATVLGWGTIPADKTEQEGSVQNATGSQVRVAADGPGMENFIGQLDNTDVFVAIANALDINDLPAVAPTATVPATAQGQPLLQPQQSAQKTLETCYQSGNTDAVPGPGDCAQYGTAGQGLDATKAKNVILFIGDGTGDSELTSARNYLVGASGRLPGVDSLPYTGFYTTYALNPTRGGPDYVTDSAASATGWAAGTKTYNGGLSITMDGTPVPHLIELAKARGLKTGNVTTSEIQDATPAAIGSHSLHRKCYGPEEAENEKCAGDKYTSQYRENGGLGSISEQLIDTRADVTMGGGAKAMGQKVQIDGSWAGHTWTKDKSVVDNAVDQGYQLVTDLDSLNKVTVADQDKPVLGLFADKNMPRLYEQTIPTLDGATLDPTQCRPNPERPDTTPTLAQMTAKSLELLDNEAGFFLQVESASIDKADHDADICGQVGEAAQFDAAIRVARNWVAQTGEPTLIIITADHAHTSQITPNGAVTAGRTTKLTTADDAAMTVNYATAKTNSDDDAIGGQTHTGAQLRVAAEGPGAANVVGHIDQTDIHYVIANALDLYRDNPKIDLTAQLGKGAALSTHTKLTIGIALGIGILLVAVAAWIASRKRQPQIDPDIP